MKDLTERVFSEKLASSLRPQQVNIKRDKEVTFLEPVGQDMDFFDTLALRKQGANPEKINIELNGDGHVFASLGVSALLTMPYAGADYAVLVKQKRPDFGDFAAKLISGYVYGPDMLQPGRVAEEEVGEEFLIFTEKGLLLPGFRNNIHLPQLEHEVNYVNNIQYSLKDGNNQRLPGVIDMHPYIKNGQVGSKNADVIFHAPTNSAQLIYHFKINMPKNYLKEQKATLHHSEAVFNKNTGMLEVKLRDKGLFLIKLDENKLTDKVFTYENGNLVPHNGELILSEAFAPKENGIVTVNNIKLIDYLKNQ